VPPPYALAAEVAGGRGLQYQDKSGKQRQGGNTRDFSGEPPSRKRAVNLREQRAREPIIQNTAPIANRPKRQGVTRCACLPSFTHVCGSHIVYPRQKPTLLSAWTGHHPPLTSHPPTPFARAREHSRVLVLDGMRPKADSASAIEARAALVERLVRGLLSNESPTPRVTVKGFRCIVSFEDIVTCDLVLDKSKGGIANGDGTVARVAFKEVLGGEVESERHEEGAGDAEGDEWE